MKKKIKNPARTRKAHVCGARVLYWAAWAHRSFMWAPRGPRAPVTRLPYMVSDATVGGRVCTPTSTGRAELAAGQR